MTRDPDIYLKLKKSSWDNFFRVMNNRKNSIELVDGSSLGNFWACIQHLEQQFKSPIKTADPKDKSEYWLSRLCEKLDKIYDYAKILIGKDKTHSLGFKKEQFKELIEIAIREVRE